MNQTGIDRDVRDAIARVDGRRHCRLVTAIAGGAIAAAGSALSYAQSVPAADASGASSVPDSSGSTLQDIVVTANRRSQSVQDVPYAISALSGADLAQLGITDMNALSHELPGVTFLNKGAYAGLANNTIIIHGLNVEITGGMLPNQTQSPVATYVDDAPVFVNLHLTDLDRVEVLRGPQGTLYGSGSLGGTVRYLQHDPDLA